MTACTDTITVIRAPGRRLTKLHAADPESPGLVRSEGYDDTKHVESREVGVASIQDIAALLRQLEGQRDSAIIRGQRLPGATGRMVRRAKNISKTGEPPGFEPRARRWLCVDLDNVPCPEGLDPAADPRAALLHLQSLLPEWLRFATCAYQWSSSAGIRGWGTLKAHLWFWLDRPVDDESLRHWARVSMDRAVDAAVYEAIQIHYTAAPVLVGVPDPVGQRSGLLAGASGVVEVPQSVWGWSAREEMERRLRREEASRRQVETRMGAGGDDPRKRVWINRALGEIKGELLAYASEGGRHDVALKVAGSLANYVQWGWLEEGCGREVLEFSPIADIPSRDGELDRVWEHALEQARRNPAPEPVLTAELRSGGVSGGASPRIGGSSGGASPSPSPDPSSLAAAPAAPIPSVDTQAVFEAALTQVLAQEDRKGAVTALVADDALLQAAALDGRGFELLALRLEDAGCTAKRVQALRDAVEASAPKGARPAGGVNIERPGGGWPDSDDRMALRLVEREGHRIRHVAGMGWLAFEGGVWSRDPGTVTRLARESARALRSEVDAVWPVEFDFYPQTEQRPWNQLSAFARNCEGEGRINAAANLARVDPGVVADPSAFDADPWMFNTVSGTIDLRTGLHRPHLPSDLLTMQTSVAWDEAATCPQWERFLLEIMEEDAEMVAFLQRVVGYSLTGSTKEQCFFILQGPGSNGKSTFVDTVKKILGGYAKSAQFQTFADTKANQDVRNDIADLRGSRFVSAVEPEEGARLAEGVVKQLTGGDAIKARFLYQEAFEFYPTFKVFLSCNPKPRIKGTDNGIWRRVRFIEFNRRYRMTETDPTSWPDADRDLPQRILGELPGILRWAVEGCMAWQRDGLAPPQKVLDATRAYRKEQDVLGQFVEDCCDLDAGGIVSSAEIYDVYQAWCQRTGHKYPLAANIFGSKLTEAYPDIQPFRSKVMRGYRGISILSTRGGAPL